MTMTSGHVLSGRFVLVRVLGGRGERVWLAQDRELGSHVVLKILDLKFPGNAALVDALEHECALLKSLSHPGIVRVDALYRDEGQLCLAMEYLSGGDLTQFRGRPAAQVLRLALPVAETLAYIHAAGIVHRDIKTENVLLAVDGTPRLVDFGLALQVAASRATWQGKGSPYSMSPQQAAGEPAHPADDIYAFGALLYELLSGYPPFYPDMTDHKRTHEPPAPLVAPVSDALRTLVERCLAKESAARPTMANVADELRKLLAMEQPSLEASSLARPVLTPPGAGEQLLQPRWQRSATAEVNPGQWRREGFQRGLTVGALLLLLSLAGVVFFVLPQRVEQLEITTPVAPVAEPEPVAEPAAPVDLQLLAQQKQEADDRFAPLSERVAALQRRAVAEWGGEAWAELESTLATASERYAVRDYIAAASLYDAATNHVNTLERRATEVLQTALERGGSALNDGQSGPAIEAFELALKLAPGQPVATRGLKRAQNLDAVMSMVSQAERLEAEGQFAAAAEAFGGALKLDPDMSRASTGLARVRARVAGDAFAAAMARGFASLAAKNLQDAKAAFESASRIRPGAAEVQQAMQQVEQEERTATIAARLATAREHEAAERWQQALADYQAVLQLDATVAAAQQGVDRVGPRATLHNELQLYVTQPERLFSAPVRETAHLALARATAIPMPGPILSKQIATLDEWLKQVTVPVAVSLESDNLTQVTIYRVGEFGTFNRRDVELLPGRYTIVGTRPGYRDVRREIMVSPGDNLSPIVIRCEDRI